jgi:DnaJ-class molecular chaperone
MGGPQVRFHTGGWDPFEQAFGQQNPFAGHPFGDIFGQMHRQQVRRNRDLNIQCQITLLDSYLGKQLEAQFQLPSGRTQTVVINVPAGISHGETIRYNGLGDDSVQGIQRGDLNVTIIVMSDPNFERRNDDLYTVVELTPIESLVGCRKSVRTISGQHIDIDIRPGVDTGVEFASTGKGFNNVQRHTKGRFVAVVKIKSTPVTDPILVERLRQLDVEIAQRG